MTGGSLTDTDTSGPLFYVTNSTGTITLKGVTVSEASGVLLSAAAGSWGTSGSNGGNATLIADGESLAGNVTADAISTAAIQLTNGSTLSGALTNASISLAATSSWSVTGDSTVVALSGAVVSGSSVTNITGNGHTVTYDATNSANSALNGGTYTLAGGGTLKPASSSALAVRFTGPSASPSARSSGPLDRNPSGRGPHPPGPRPVHVRRAFVRWNRLAAPPSIHRPSPMPRPPRLSRRPLGRSTRRPCPDRPAVIRAHMTAHRSARRANGRVATSG